MRVAIVSRTPPSECGIAEYVSMLASVLNTYANVEVVLVGNSEGVGGLGIEYVDKYSGSKCVSCFSVNDTDYDGIVKCIKELSPDVVHIQHEYGIFKSLDGFIKLLKGIKELGCKLVVTLHTVAHALKGSEYVSFQRELVRLADAVIVHSVLQEYELIMEGVDPSKLFRIPHGTLLNPYRTFSKSRLSRELMIKDLVTDGYILITTPGFIRRDKGLATLLKATELISKYYDVKLLLVGTPQFDGHEYLGEISELLKSLGDAVVFIKRFLNREELLKFIALNDLIVFPYVDKYHLGVSGAFHLAIGTHRPVVCSRAPRLIECYEVAPEATVPKNEPELIARKVIEFIENPEEALEVSRKLWNYAIKTSWERVGDVHRELYYDVLEGGTEVIVSTSVTNLLASLVTTSSNSSMNH